MTKLIDTLNSYVYSKEDFVIATLLEELTEVITDRNKAGYYFVTIASNKSKLNDFIKTWAEDNGLSFLYSIIFFSKGMTIYWCTREILDKTNQETYFKYWINDSLKLEKLPRNT